MLLTRLIRFFSSSRLLRFCCVFVETSGRMMPICFCGGKNSLFCWHRIVFASLLLCEYVAVDDVVIVVVAVLIKPKLQIAPMGLFSGTISFSSISLLSLSSSGSSFSCNLDDGALEVAGVLTLLLHSVFTQRSSSDSGSSANVCPFCFVPGK